MAIYLPDGLPALAILRGEGVPVCGLGTRSGTLPRIGLLNLMPDKISTETQFSRLLALAGRDAELVLLRPSGFRNRHTSRHHMKAHYQLWNDLRGRPLDGLIVSGAPVEMLAFEAVEYWDELVRIFDHCATRRLPALHVCWSAQAALYHYHGVPKHRLPCKLFGVYPQAVLDGKAGLTTGLGEIFPVPVSRHTEVRAGELPAGNVVRVLSESRESGLCIVEDTITNAVCLFNHLEYDADTLTREYARDLRAGKPINRPIARHSAQCSTPDNQPPWRKAAVRFFGNWVAKVGETARVLPSGQSSDRIFA